jgi:carbonic anhydrase
MDTPQYTPLERLKEGNQRFINGYRSVESIFSHKKMPELASMGQKPFAIILTCSDSRSPVELIFDQGVGDLFVVRVAGNVVAPSLIASIEFAAANFGSPLLLVLGHTQCGAVTAAVEKVDNPSHPLPSSHLEELIARIRPAVESIRGDHEDRLSQAIVANIKRSAMLLQEQSTILRKLISEKKISVFGGILDISSGAVTFLDEVGIEN